MSDATNAVLIASALGDVGSTPSKNKPGPSPERVRYRKNRRKKNKLSKAARQKNRKK